MINITFNSATRKEPDYRNHVTPEEWVLDKALWRKVIMDILTNKSSVKHAAYSHEYYIKVFIYFESYYGEYKDE